MAKVLIVGNALVVKSSYPTATWEKLAKYAPKSLSLYEGEGKETKPVFKVGLTTGEGSVNQYGVSFNGTDHGTEKLATLTMLIPADVEDAKAWAEETIGTAIIKLNKVEKGVKEALDAVNAELKEVRENISVA